MADTLLFRGGSSASIAVSTVQNRELVIDTDTYQIVSGASKKKTVMEDSNGDVEIGGGNIELRAGGSIVAAADATINDVTVGRGGGSDASNSVVGQGALGNNTTGTNNTAIGRSALSTNTTGSYNTALGRFALFLNTEGAFNTALGQSALNKNTIGSYNTTLGQNSLYLNTEGSNNTAIGQGALQSNTTGDFNTALGLTAGYFIEGSNNTILGAYKGTSADSSLSNTVVISAGTTERLRIDSTGSLLFGGTLPASPNITFASTGAITALVDATINNVKVGRGGGSITTNTAIGTNTLNANTTGNSNTAIGRDALRTNTIGNFNTALGQNALFKNTEGGYNAAIGQDALRNNTEGDNNSAVGQGSLTSNTTGGHNTAIGVNAGFYIEGSNNTILGAYKGTAADSTLSNTVIISAGTTERARCNSSGDWDFGSLILKSPDGTSFRLSVANDGTLSASSI